MIVTAKQVQAALQRAIDEQEHQLAKLVERKDWREAGYQDAYLAGLRFAAEQVAMLRLEED